MQLYFSTTKLKIHSIIVTRTGVLNLKTELQPFKRPDDKKYYFQKTVHD